MPRIPGPEEVRPLGPAIGLPRTPAYVRGATQPLDALNEAAGRVGGVSQQIADRMIAQERANARLKFQADLTRDLASLQEQVSRLDPSEARAAWDNGASAISSSANKRAADLGMEDELSPVTDEVLARNTLSVHQGIAARLDQATLHDLDNAATIYENKLAGASSLADYSATLTEFADLAHRTSAAVPAFTASDARAAIRTVAEKGQTRRAQGMIRGALGNQSALAAAQTAVLDEKQFPNLPTDVRGTLSQMAYQLRAQAEDDVWQKQQRQYALLARTRQETQLSTMEGMMAKLGAGGHVSDQELTLALAEGKLDPSLANFISNWRDGQGAGFTTDLFTYNQLRQQAEYGTLQEPDVYAALQHGDLGDGHTAVNTAKQLLDTNASAARQGGLMRDEEVKTSRDLIMQVITGSVGKSPDQVVQDFMNASDTEKRLVTRAQIEFDARMKEYQDQGVRPPAFSPRKVAGQVLQGLGFKPTRPTPPQVPGPFDMGALNGMETNDIRDSILPRLQNALANPNLSRDKKAEMTDQMWAVRGYIDQLNSWRKSTETIDLLTEGLPKETK